MKLNAVFIPFSAQSRMSGVDITSIGMVSVLNKSEKDLQKQFVHLF